MHTSPTASLGHSANGGMNVYVHEVCAAFSECGIATDVFTRRVGADDPEVERMSGLSRVVYLPAGHDHDDKYALTHHVEEFAAGTLDFITENHLDYRMIYSHYWLSGMVGGRLSMSLGLPWAHTAHTLGLVKNRQLAPGAEPEPLERIQAERLIAGQADLQIVSTETEAEDLAHLYGADPDRVAVVAPGIDLMTFSPMQRAVARKKIGYEGGRLLLFVGRLERLKGVETILRALAQAGGRRSHDARLLVVGGDSRGSGQSEKERLRALAAELRIADRVDFVGSVAHHELPYFYSAADVCLMPSYTESFGLVGLEAQACGCPVIASDVSGLASVVRDGVTGYLVPSHEPGAWADRLIYLFDHPEEGEQMGRRAVLLAQRFTWARTADRIWAAMEGVLVPESQGVARPN